MTGRIRHNRPHRTGTVGRAFAVRTKAAVRITGNVYHRVPRGLATAWAARILSLSECCSNQQRHQAGIVAELGRQAEVVPDEVLHPAASLFGKLFRNRLDGLPGQHERCEIQT